MNFKQHHNYLIPFVLYNQIGIVSYLRKNAHRKNRKFLNYLMCVLSSVAQSDLRENRSQFTSI